ncbi:unnamed protein product [Meloidogyne enterolobii]|uniref:Uncharacterized protein n=1 Tax=Meloidogyne enterolobii TaxID=390850 RepID=A0ACB1AR23_MELEN
MSWWYFDYILPHQNFLCLSFLYYILLPYFSPLYSSLLFSPKNIYSLLSLPPNNSSLYFY